MPTNRCSCENPQPMKDGLLCSRCGGFILPSGAVAFSGVDFGSGDASVQVEGYRSGDRVVITDWRVASDPASVPLPDLASEGYQPMAPSVEHALVDGQFCADAVCVSCNHHGAEYRPWSLGASYRRFAVCPGCGRWFEF